MISPADERALRRHDLVYPSVEGWRTALSARPELAGEPPIAAWAAHGRPLIVRRGTPCEAAGVTLGLPLPPSQGKRRLPFVLPRDAVVSTAPPPLVTSALDVAPASWRPTMRTLAELAESFGGQARLYGSLAWEHLTGLAYLTPTSDLDVLMPLPRGADVARLTAALAALERSAPMRLDGELMRDDGAGVCWRELHAGAPEVLVKTLDHAALLHTACFLAAEAVA